VDRTGIDYNHYISCLEELVAALKQNIQHLVRPDLDLNNLAEIDRYLLEINSYYYKSFHDQVFPWYKDQIKEQVNEQLGLNRQLNLVYHDIMANLKRYAKLFNRIKTLLGVLDIYQGQIRQLSQSLRSHSMWAAMDFLNTLEKTGDALDRTGTNLAHLARLAGESDLLNALKTHPAVITQIRSLSSLDWNNPQTGLELDLIRLLVRYSQREVSALIASQDEYPLNIKQVREDLLQRSRELGNRELKETASFYQEQIHSHYRHYCEHLRLQLQTGDYNQIGETVKSFESWLASLLLILEKSPPYIGNDQTALIMNLDQVNGTNRPYLSSLLEKLLAARDAVRSLASDLSRAPAPSLSLFIDKTRELMHGFDHGFFNQAEEELGQHLYSIIMPQLKAQLSLLKFIMKSADEKQQHAEHLASVGAAISDSIAAHSSILHNTRVDLERMLAPRNISRTWRELAIKVDRIPIERGKPFPENYLYILDKHQVETRVSASYSHNTVLEEEGDLFIIKVGQLTDEEVPYMVIAQKGVD
jgi:hypothetical protein